MAFQRLQNLEKRLARDPEVSAYGKIIEKYLDKGYVRKIDNFEEKPIVRWYLPHFAVVRNDRKTTKTRVVFDASAKFNKCTYEPACLWVIIDIDFCKKTVPHHQERSGYATACNKQISFILLKRF